MRKARDYRQEYARRDARGRAKGLSKSQIRGHSKAHESTLRALKPISDDRLQLALRTLRQEQNFAAAAKAGKIAPERLRKYALEKGLIEKEGRRWRVKAELPRFFRGLPTNGRSVDITVGDFESASLVGGFLTAVGQFLNTNNRALLTPFIGMSVKDIAGKEHLFETRPNVLYRLSARGGESFEQIYRIVI